MNVKSFILFLIVIFAISMFLSSCAIKTGMPTGPVSSPSGTATVIASVTPSASPIRECNTDADCKDTSKPACNKEGKCVECTRDKHCPKDDYYDIKDKEDKLVTEWRKKEECKDEEWKKQEWKNWYCKEEKCLWASALLEKNKFRWVPTGGIKNWPDGATCDPPGDSKEGYCKDGVCNEKTCNIYSSEGWVPCPDTPSLARDCCPKGYQCCNDKRWDMELGARCCLNKPYQRCGVANLPWYEYENVCVDLQCPDSTWHMCGNPELEEYPSPDASQPNLGKSRCCKWEKYCTPEDMAKNRCGDTCAEFSTISGCSMDKCPEPEEDYERREGLLNSVCCKKGVEVPFYNERFGVWFCTVEKCPEGKHLCKGTFYNICCDAGSYCIDDTEEPTCKPFNGKTNPYPWPSVAPSPKASLSPEPTASPSIMPT